MDSDVGPLHFYRVPWRRDTVRQVMETFEEARRKLERLETKTKAQEPGEQGMALLMTLPV